MNKQRRGCGGSRGLRSFHQIVRQFNCPILLFHFFFLSILLVFSLFLINQKFTQFFSPYLLARYHPIKHACWRRGEFVPYQALCATFEKMEATPKRLEMVMILRNFFRCVCVCVCVCVRVCVCVCVCVCVV